MEFTPADNVCTPAAACRDPLVGLDALFFAANEFVEQPVERGDLKSSPPSPPREQTVGLPPKLYCLVRWAASDTDVIKYICPGLLANNRSSCSMGRLLVACLTAFGCHEPTGGKYVHSKDNLADGPPRGDLSLMYGLGAAQVHDIAWPSFDGPFDSWMSDVSVQRAVYELMVSKM